MMPMFLTTLTDSQPTRSRILHRLRQFVLAILAIYIGFSLLSAVVYFALQPNMSRVELFKMLYELSLWFAVPVLISLIILRTWRLVLGSIILVGIFLLIYLPYLVPRNPVFPNDAPQVRIMTFNTLATSDELANAIRSADADIVGLQELSQAGAEVVESLEDIYPYQALHPQPDENEGQGILSRYPITADDYWTYPDLAHTLGHQRVEIDVDGTTIVMYNTHPWPPLAFKTGFNDESHRVALADITERVFDETLPLILVGDFNMTPVFEEYERLNTRLTDTFKASGDGTGYTFPNHKYAPLPKLLRLDYVWVSEEFHPIESIVRNYNGESDHSPVVSTVAFVIPTESD